VADGDFHGWRAPLFCRGVDTLPRSARGSRRCDHRGLPGLPPREHGDTKDADVVVQWDPERDVRGTKLPRRSIQVGLGRGIVRRYVDDWTKEIRDVTPLVATLRRLREDGEWDRVKQQLPMERPYPLPAAIRQRLGMEGHL
jgi:Domain of unknown function (DUF4291)